MAVFCCLQNDCKHTCHTQKITHKQIPSSSPPDSLSQQKPINTSSYRFFIMSSVNRTASNTEISTLPSVNNVPSPPTAVGEPTNDVVIQGHNLPTTPKKESKKRSLPLLLKTLRPDLEWNPERRRWYDYNVVDRGLEKLREKGIDVNVTWREFSSTDKAIAETTFHTHLTALFKYTLMYF